MTEQLSISNYHYKSWGDKFPDHQVDLTTLAIESSWSEMFMMLKEKNLFQRIDKYLSHCLKVTYGKVPIYPYPDAVFNCFNLLPMDEVKVVILGQDPYHNAIQSEDTTIPQAMGLSFSVPHAVEIPSSLNNIYNNLLKHGHIPKKPTHGNLTFWVYQGCLLLNTSLTVQHGYPNSHSMFWLAFTDEIIRYISEKLNNIVFILWGKPALEKLKLINADKHKCIISSHPSGLSYTKTLGKYPSFMNSDFAAETNEHLIRYNKTPIIWQIV